MKEVGQIKDIFFNLKQDQNNIFISDFKIDDQSEEHKYRSQWIKKTGEISSKDQALSHSIPVMDKEIKHFLKLVPENGIVLDIGGGWGFHWRNLNLQRPDITVVILDFVYENLIAAKQNLLESFNKSIFLVYGNATQLGFSNNIFDGCWSVQAIQHIPKYDLAYNEIYRVLKINAPFANYGLNFPKYVNSYLKIFKRGLKIKDHRKGIFYLERFTRDQYQTLERIFKNKVTRRYSEVLFLLPLPKVNTAKFGLENSFIGKIDSCLSGSLFSNFSRQQSYHTFKK